MIKYTVQTQCKIFIVYVNSVCPGSKQNKQKRSDFNLILDMERRLQSLEKQNKEIISLFVISVGVRVLLEVPNRFVA